MSLLGLRERQNSKKQGNVGLAIAIAWFEEHDYETYIPLTDSQSSDLVVKKAGRYFGVQVKTTYFKSPYGIYMANLRVSG